MILLDYKDRRPIYEQVTQKLKDLILIGALEQGSQLPSVRSLATDLSINPNTIQRAYAELEREGFIFSIKGRGSFVSESNDVKSIRMKEFFAELEVVIDNAKLLKIEKEQFLLKAVEFYDKGRNDI